MKLFIIKDDWYIRMFAKKCIYHLSIYVSLVALDIYARINDSKNNVAIAWLSMIVIMN